MKRNIGLFLAYGPGLIKNNEGILRLSLALLRNDEFRKRVLIAMPNWSRKEFKQLLQEENIPDADLQFLYHRKRTPLLFLLYGLYLKLKARKKKRTPRNRFDRFGKWILLIASRNIFLLAILSPLAFPYLFYSALKPLIKKIAKKLVSKIKEINRTIINKKNIRIKNVLRPLYSNAKYWELKQLVKKINRRKDIDVWYIPTGFWPEIKEIRKPKVIACPDVVLQELPFVFASNSDLFEESYHKIRETLAIQAQFLCYSEHVKQNHLQHPFHIPECGISVLKHGCTDLASHLKGESALQILARFQREHLHNRPYLSQYHFPSMKYLFYSSKVRPHKNVLNLIKSFELLLRKRFINIKLILTGSLQDNETIASYVQERGLQKEIISLPGVSNEVLAALNQRAICSVNPSLFEGGFPFTFCEAYSVGTPSVMSRIPAVSEEIEDAALLEKMSFDPCEVKEMADRIEWAISHREELFFLQKPLYEKLSARTWDLVAKEYLNLLDTHAS